jgi:hypothetical protein
MHGLSRDSWPGLLTVLLLLQAGCGGNSPSNPTSTGSKVKGENPGKESPAVKDSKNGTKASEPFRTVQLARFDETIKEHKGKVVLADLWFDG